MGTGYCVTNGSGHSAFSPHLGLLVFLPVFLAGAVLIISGFQRRTGILAITMGVLGSPFSLFVDKLGIMLSYEDWVRRGLGAQMKTRTSFWVHMLPLPSRLFSAF